MELPGSLAARYWNYSLSAYAQADVQALSLQLQRDYQANVNLLLFAGFVASSGRALGNQEWASIEAALTPFNRRYTQRIRRLRERVQRYASSHSTANECYQQLKALELRAERLEQQLVVVSCDNELRLRLSHRENCANGEHILHNLLAYYASWPAKSTAAEEVLCKLAIALARNSEIKGNHSQR